MAPLARRLLFPSSLAATSALIWSMVAGCSGASSQDVFESNSKAASSSGTSGATTSGGTSGTTTSGGTSGTTTSGGTSGTTTSGGTSGTAADASPPCPQEMEPNDQRNLANTLAPTLCGSITPSIESDFLTFELAEKTTSMQLKFDGQVTLRVDVNGQFVTLGNGQSPMVPFVKGKKYIVEVKAINAVSTTAVPWRVDLIEM